MSFLYLQDEQPAKGQKCLLATTAYDSPDASHTASIAATRAAMAEAGIATAYALLSGNCHVDDARNSIVSEFLKTDCTDLVFLDADVSWEPRHLVRLCQHTAVDIVGGVYPKRAEGHNDMPVRMIEGITAPDERGLLDVEGLPTGFLRIRRYVIERMAAQAKTFRKGANLEALVPILFERDYVEGVGRRGGDIAFCMRARDMGFSVQADCELVLGHAAKVIVKGSLGQALRRQTGTTLQWVAAQVRAGAWTFEHVQEAIDHVANDWAAQAVGITAALQVLRDKPGPVLETGSGLSTVLMAAAVPDHYVYALEHDPIYAMQLRRLAKEAGVKNIGLVEAPIDPETGWYTLAEMDGIKDKRFALGFCDGPPRGYKSRTRFITHCAPLCDVIIADDVDQPDYQRAWIDYAKRRNRDIVLDGRIAIIK